MPKTFCIVNPRAAQGRATRQWPRIADLLYRTIGAFEYDFTNGIGVGTVLAAAALARGFRRLIAVGGDGTLNEVVNGCLTEAGEWWAEDVVVGGIPLGSGGDSWKGLGWPSAPEAAVRFLAHRKSRRCDLLRIVLQSHDARPLVRYAVNVVDIGVGAEVVNRAKRLPGWSGATANYLLGAVGAFWDWRAPMVELTVDGAALDPQAIVTILAANGPACGGGMRPAPQAAMDDGRFDLVIVRETAKWRLVELLPRLYAGTLATHDAVHVQQAERLTVGASLPIRVQLDGEVVGFTPLELALVPGRLSVVA